MEKLLFGGWLRGRPLHHDEPYTLRPGDLVTLRILPKRPEEMAWSAEYLPNAAIYYHDTVTKSGREPIERVQWTLHYVTETGDATTITKEVCWKTHQQPYEVVESFRTSICSEASFETYFVPYGRAATGRDHFVAHPASEQNEVCLISIIVQTPAGIEEETTQGVTLTPTTSTNHMLTAAGYPRWDNSGSCAVTVQVNGEVVTDEGGITVRSGDYVQMTVSVASWRQLAEDLLQADAEGTSLLQLRTTQTSRVTLRLYDHLDIEGDTPKTVKLPIDNEQVAQLLGAWHSIPLRQVDQLPGTIELPEATIHKLQQVRWSENANILHIFTDGSFDADSGTMAWSFVAVYANDDNYQAATDFYCLGYACGHVSTDPDDEQWKGASDCNAYVAEMEALLHAHWWAIGNHQGHGLHFHYDALSAGNAAKGVWGFSPSHKLCSLTRILAQSVQICSTTKVNYKHVPAHNGDPWNELADVIANSCRKGNLSPNKVPHFSWQPWLDGSYVIAAEHLPLALQVLQGRHDLPAGNGSSLTFHNYGSVPPSESALWPLDLQDECNDQKGGKVETVQLKCCSYNVRTLQDPKVGPPVGVAEYLRAQFTHLQYHVCALQETRAKSSSTVESADYIRLIVAGEGGQEGTELWFSKTARIGHHEPCALQHLTVLHQEPTIISVRMRIGQEFLVILSVHAPHSGYSESDREAWWNRLEKVIRNARTRGRLILMGDVNAQLGEAIEGAIGDVLNAKTTRNGAHFSRLLQNTSLWLPATYHQHHKGDTGTWIHPGTKQSIRLDYVAIDHRFAAFDLDSAVEDEIIHPGTGEDHRAVRLTFCFALRRRPNNRRRAQIDEIALADPSNEAQVEEVFRAVRAIPWSANVHDHYATLAKTLHDELSRIFPQHRKAPRRHYISRATWMCRASKLAMKKSLREARKRGDHEGADLLVQQIKDATTQLRGLLQADKQHHVDDLLEHVDRAPPRQLFAQLRRLGIGAQMKKYSNKALPIQWGGERGLYMDGTQAETSEIIAETVWADDLALFFQHPDPDQLVANLRVGSTTLLNACMRYGLEPNFARGKTEAIVALRGKGSVRSRRTWFTENNGRLYLPDCDAPETYIRMIARYRHLGGQVDARATSRAEVQARTGQVRQVFRRYKKSLFAAQGIAREKRAQLLRPFVLSVLEYNLGTLVGLTDTDKQCVATTLLSIYRTVWRDGGHGPDDYKISWPRLCYALQLPSPNAIIQMARIRYFSQVLRHGGSALWALISTQQGWLQDCREAFEWMYQQVSGSSMLRNPAEDWGSHGES